MNVSLYTLPLDLSKEEFLDFAMLPSSWPGSVARVVGTRKYESLGRSSIRISGDKDKQSGPCFVPVTQRSSLDDVCGYVCRKPVDLLSADDVLAPVQSGARSAFAHLRIDSFSRFFSSSMPPDQQQLATLYGKLCESDNDGDGGDRVLD